MRAQYFINYTLISLISICGFAVINKMEFGFYGLAWGSLLFCLIFLLLAIREFVVGKNTLTAIEFIGLSVIAFVFFCKGWLFLFSGMHTIYLIGLILIVILNGWSIRILTKQHTEMQGKIYLIKVLLRLSVIMFVASEIINIRGYDGYLYFYLLGLLISFLTFLAIIWAQVVYFYQNKKLQEVIGIQSFNSYWLLLGFMLIFTFRIAVNYGLTDEVKFHRLPTEYVELFYRAESGLEEPVDGKYQYQKYFEQYEEIMDNYVRAPK